ncbi:MAG: hypothetical protein LBT29_04900 [Flavobacteriaceae bacterium]|nr:hypothetical protein [Flavobacteriaceae bacterium]
MKKIFSSLFLALSFGLTFTSCNNDNDNYQDTDTIAAVFTVNKATFQYDSSLGKYVIEKVFPSNFQFYDSDHVLVYRQSGSANGAPIWQLLPTTVYLHSDVNGDGYSDDIFYDFDFSVYDVYIYADSTYDLSLTPALYANQNFRIVVIPGGFVSYSASGTKTTPVDYKDYNAVIKYYHLDDSKVKELK